MLQIAKKIFGNRLNRLIILLVLIMAGCGFGSGHFIFVRAYDNQLNVFPENYSVEFSGELEWQGVNNAFYQDLSRDSEFDEFNLNNSAFILNFNKIDKSGGSDEENQDSVETEDESEGVVGHGTDEQYGHDSKATDGQEDLEEQPPEVEKNGTQEEELDSTGADQNKQGEANPGETDVQQESEEFDTGPDADMPNSTDIVEQTSESQDSDQTVTHEEEFNEEDQEPQTANEDDDSSVQPETSETQDNSDSVPNDTDVDKTQAEERNSGAEEPLSLMRLFKTAYRRVCDSLKQMNPLGIYGAIAQDATPTPAVLVPSETSTDLLFTNFNVPLRFLQSEVGEVTLSLSLSASSTDENDSVKISYSVYGEWEEIAELKLAETLSNNDNNGYYEFVLPDELDWDDVNNLEIKVAYVSDSENDDGKKVEIYLDALWLEIEYDDGGLDLTEDGEVLGVEESLDSGFNEEDLKDMYDFELLSDKLSFTVDEKPVFKFQLSRRRGFLAKVIERVTSFIFDEYSDFKIAAKVVGEDGEENIPVRIKYMSDGEFDIELRNLPRNFRPGKHTLAIVINDTGILYTASQDFTWGVLAFNVNKSIYAPNETAYLQMAVLDDNGDTLCEVESLELEITDPDGQISILSLDNGLLIANPECGPNNVIDTPDFYTYFDLTEVGEYKVKLTSVTDNGARSIEDRFEVRDSVLFDIERIGPTRIYPAAKYDMEFIVKPKVDFVGRLKETVPAGFIMNFDDRFDIFEKDDVKELVWQVSWKAGETYKLKYRFDAPDVSPEFYLLGPARLSGVSKSNTDEEFEFVSFGETRQWQIAGDDQFVFNSAGTSDFEVPPGVNEITVKVWGAGGGGGGADNNTWAGGDGGGAGFVYGTIAVTPGETLTVDVGGGGGGGDGGNSYGSGGGGGGGYSAVRRGLTYLFIAAAGGGGGGGDDNVNGGSDGGNGGVGGGESGTDGADGGNGGSAEGGYAGTQSAGGAGGNGPDYDGTDGASLSGGAGGGEDFDVNGGAGGTNGGGAGGGDSDNGDDMGGGGGGGAGYYGGGGGANYNGADPDGTGGGGGGSSYIISSAYATTTISGSGTTAGSSTDPDYAGSAGQGGAGSTANAVAGSPGNAGLVVFNYTPDPEVVVGATGTQVSTIDAPSNSNYIGGAFVLTEQYATRTIDSITITEDGSIDAENYINDVELYYDLDEAAPYDCVDETYAITDSQFGTTSASGFSSANGTITFNDSVEIATDSVMCLYTVMDIGVGVSNGATINIFITDPSSDVVLNSGTVTPGERVDINGTTTLVVPQTALSVDAQRKSDNFTAINNGAWTDEDEVYLLAYAGNSGGATSSVFNFYFELLDEDGIYTTATSEPATYCNSGVAYGSCSSKTWFASSSISNWYDSNWLYRKKLTINASQVRSTESGFVVLATTTDADLAHTDNGGHVGHTSGYDLVVTDSDAVTPLNYEREFYSSSTGEIAIWIKTDISSTTNKEIYLYYGNSSASVDYATTTGVWSDDYLGVWHMSDDPTGPALYDSTANDNDAIPNGGWNSGDLVRSEMGYAIDFPGANNQEFQIANSGNWLDGKRALTVDIWLHSNNLNVDQGIYTCDEGEADTADVMLRYDTSGWAGGGDDVLKVVYQYESAEYQQTTDRQHITYAWESGKNIEVFIDGAKDVPTSVGGAGLFEISSCATFLIGDQGQGASGNWDGLIDEFRISSTTRTGDWILTEFNSYNNVDSFITFGNEETSTQVSAEGYVNITNIPDRGTVSDEGYMWQGLACNENSECSFWNSFNSSIPNFKIDDTDPDTPGNLTISTTTPTTIVLDFGTESSDANFAEYRIYYKTGVSGVNTGDIRHNDSNLAYVDYNSAASTTISGLEANTQYVINIWAYDEAGNMAAANELVVTTASAPHSRAQTVIFNAGNYSGNGSVGQLSNTDQSFNTFNWSLAETDVDIRSAYVLFEAQFESYHANSSDYSGYELSFDVCEESCTADAWNSSDNLNEDSNTVLAYDETESNQIRLLWDVTNETQLAVYTGNGTNMEAQIGYKLETDTATSSISHARATLVVTYAYNSDDTTSYTNTVVYPLESNEPGDSGSRQSTTTELCTKNVDCPTFDYNIKIPELNSSLSHWFEMQNVNDGNGANDIQFDVNLQGTDIDSNTYVHESANGGTQGAFPTIDFSYLNGYTQNATQTMETYLSTGTNYMLGGEAFETYTALKSANTKTRTVSFPIGVISKGQSITTASNTVTVYFPENGNGSGVVNIEKAWFRVIGNNTISGAQTVTLSSKVGDNPQGSNYVYDIDPGGAVIKPSYKVIHVISVNDYSELELANSVTGKEVAIYVTNSSTDFGGVSAELMITYTYTSEVTGYLSSLNLYGGQSSDNGNATTSIKNTANSVFPELRGDEILRAASLLSSYNISDSDNNVQREWIDFSSNIATDTPVCSASYDFRPDNRNGFGEFYFDVSSQISTADDMAYISCLGSVNPLRPNHGSKMNAIWLYTYQWDAVPAEYTQNDWRWYDNADASSPGSAMAAENTSVSGVNTGDVLRLRMNVVITREELSASTQTFKLQFAEGADCTMASGWQDLGGLTDSEIWRGYNNPNPADGATIGSTLLASSTVLQTYEEYNISASNPNSIPINGQGEWDWVIYNNGATSTTNYCFRMVQGSGSEFDDYLSDSYAQVYTASSNTAPDDPSSLAQYRSDGVTSIVNSNWINEDAVKLSAQVTDPNMSEQLTLYFQLASNSEAFITATSVPVSPCDSGTDWEVCSSRVWQATSSLGDYRSSAFTGSVDVINLAENSPGYKWQALACDDSGDCSNNWVQLGAIPNFKVDTIAPGSPGDLSQFSVQSTSIIVQYGAASSEKNFDEYRIYYKIGSKDVTESDTEHIDVNLEDQNYNGYTTTTVDMLTANTQYVFNIFAYDKAGNKASATQELVATTTSSFTPPTATIVSAIQKDDGSGAVDVVIEVDDADNDDSLRAKVYFATGTDCTFDLNDLAYINEADSKTTATYGDPKIDNNFTYRVGSSSGWILTSPGSNFVFFDWMSKQDVPLANSTYCVGVVVSDGQFESATDTEYLIIDNISPTTPAPLSLNSKDYDSITLNLNTPYSSDTRFSEYRIFYKEGTSGVGINDNEHNDANLNSANYGGANTTTVNGLNPNTEYVFNILAFDTLGNRSTSTEVNYKTNAGPVNISADNQYRSNGTTLIPNGTWIDDNQVVFKASAHDQDAGELLTFYFEVETATGTFTSATTPPAGACASTTPYESCSSKIWEVSTTSSTLPPSWYNENWLYRKQITINSSQVATTVSGFVVLATTTDSDLAADARSDGYDILFTDSSGTTSIPYEREYYNGATGELVAWIKTDVSSTTNTTIYMYYGNSGAIIDNATTTGVWDSDFISVLHLEESVTDEGSQVDAHIDSSGNSNNADQYGNEEINGQVYRGQDYDGVDDYAEIDDDNSLDLSDSVTVDFWMKGVASAQTATKTVYTSAGADSFVVPAGVTEITIKAWGAGGGGGGGSDTDGGEANQNGGGTGGGGGFSQGTYSVVPGQTLDILVGGGGTAGGLVTDSGSGGGGGGRTEVSVGATSIIIAGGGGGGGGGADDNSAFGGTGGAGGALTGQDGGDVSGATGGSGGTQLAGGAAGTGGTNDGTAGVADTGGAGADGRNGQGADGSGPAGGIGGGANGGLADINTGQPAGGGGGGGYYGGGGGSMEAGTLDGGTGGGGGSSYLNPSLSATSTSGGTDDDAANTADTDYQGSAGQGGNGGQPGGSGTDGDDGLIVISYVPSVPLMRKGTSTYQLSLDNSLNLYGQINDESVSQQIVEGWHHVALVYDRNMGGTAEMKLLVDGEVVDTADYSTIINTNNLPIKIAKEFDGIIDEFRISSVARDKAYLKTNFNNQHDVSSFLSIASEGTVTSYFESLLLLTIPDNPHYSAGYKWQVMACDDDSDCTSWDVYNASTPNFKIDTTDPTAPGTLALNSKTANSVTLDFGAQTNEDNFKEYKIYYSSSTPVTESDQVHSSSSDANLGFVDYNSQANTTISGLTPNTTYYFSIWAYDIVGHKASSTWLTVTSNQAISSPGVSFYTKNDRTLYYMVWDGSDWGAEQSGPTLGSGVGDNIMHVRAVSSDDRGRVAVFAKTWDGTNQEWWGTVYRFAADDFVNTSQLGSAQASQANYNKITGCIAPLSGKEFMVVRNNNASDGTLVYSWNTDDGWSSEGAGPNPVAVMNGCELIRRPSTNNYLLMTYDDDSDVGSAYYYGGSTYVNSWTAWTQHSGDEDDVDNYVGQAFFDPNDNTKGAVSYSNSASNDYAYAKYFICGNSTINFGAAVASPSTDPEDWSNDFVHGEFAVDPGVSGFAYFVGRDIDDELNVYKVDISNPTIAWSTTTNGDNISDGVLYTETNYSQKPFDADFYKSGKGLVTWASSTSATTPYYNIITTSNNFLNANSITVPGAGDATYVRARIYNDPIEDESIVLYQNTDVDYSAVFFSGGNNRFFNTVDDVGSNQVWTDIVTNSGVSSSSFENITFGYTAYNQEPNNPTNLGQYKIDNSAIANQGWTNETTVQLNASAIDPDTSEVVVLYVQLISSNDILATTTNGIFSACDAGTTWDACNSKIWHVATSSQDDYSINPFTATATISSIASSSVGYKWQAIACDDENECSGWTIFNVTTPNFRIDDKAPSIPGNLSDVSVDSDSVTLNFGAAVSEDFFEEYIIYYKIGSSDVTESDSTWSQANDSDLGSRTFNGTSGTTITGLASSTQYVFNIFAYDEAGNTASATVEISTTTTASANLRQMSYLLENDDGADVNSNSAEVAASTTLNNIYIGERMAVRIQLENNGEDLTGNTAYRLQYRNYTDSGAWTNVGASTEISYSLGLSGSNGNQITSSKASANTNSWANGRYFENTSLSSNINLSEGTYTELVYMINTANATTSKTYQMRLYNNTASKILDDYRAYPAFTTIANDTIRYTKQTTGSLPSNISDLTYYLDPEGYADVATNDSTNYDEMTSSNYQVIMFATKHTNNTDAASSTWIGRSTVAPSTRDVVLQVYRRGSSNSWVSVDTNSSAGAATDFSLHANINSNVSEYYDTDNWIYWRVYQDSGSQTLSSDYYANNFHAPVAYVEQIHYRWRYDDGDEDEANWMEAEDTGNPTLGDELGKGSTTRLRFSVANTGGGTATNYNYQLEYASTVTGCASDPGGWTTVPTTAVAQHFEMVDSTYYTDGDAATAQFANAEGYTFVSGEMIDNNSNSSDNITLTEGDYTEVEYTFSVTNNATDAGSYCFRVTDVGTDLNEYDIYAAVTIAGNTNIAPSFTISPSDTGSASTTPTNENSDVTFSATANDPEGDDYYLAVCGTNSINPGVNTAPTCSDYSWCVSSAASSTDPATCAYAAATTTEVNDWYAYVCDKVPGFGISRCSASSQGSGTAANNSPFVINHMPVFTQATTTDDNNAPGGSFTITAYATDTDVSDTADTLYLYVCTKDNAVYGAGCAGAGNQTLCSDTADASPDISCSFSTSSPAKAGQFTYYAYLYDSHGLAANPSSRSNTYIVKNVAPTLGTLYINGGGLITLNIRPNTTDVTVSNSSVQDLNGCTDLDSSTAVAYMSNAANGYNCTSNKNDCYQINNSNCEINGCLNDEDINAEIICTTSLEYYAIPTDDSDGNPWEPYNWLGRLQIYDGANYVATSSEGVELETTTALDLASNLIDYGSGIFPGENTGDNNATTTIINAGNSPIDANIKGTDMTSTGDSIAVNNQQYDFTPFSYGTANYVLSSTYLNIDLVAPKPTTTIDVTEDIFWGIGVPYGKESDTYEGVNTFTVELDDDNWN